MKTQGCVGRCGTGLSRLATGWIALMVAASLLTTSERAQGEIVTLHFSGTVTSIGHTDPENFDLDESVVIGSPYQLTFTIETNASDIDPEPDRGRYLLIASSGSVGNYSWSQNTALVYEVETADNLGGIKDRIEFGQPDPDFAGTFQLRSVPTFLEGEAFEFVYAGVDLYDSSMSALQSDSLVVPDLSEWDTRYLTMHFILDPAAVGIDAKIHLRGTVDGISMPEPGTTVLFGLLFACFGRGHRTVEYAGNDQHISSA